MSIAPMVRVALLGPRHVKAQALAQAQELGCLHVRPLVQATDPLAPDRPQARRALAFLLAGPARRHAARRTETFDAQAVEHDALRIEARLRAVDEEQRALRKRLRVLAPWGDYRMPPDLPARGLRLWFYVMPDWRLRQLPDDLVAWSVVARDPSNCWVAVIHPDEPQQMPVPRAHTGSLPLYELRQRLDDLEVEHDDLQAERVALTRWCDALARSLARLEDAAALRRVDSQTWADDSLFALGAWAPEAAVPELRALADRCRLALVIDIPAADDDPPTWLDNRGNARAGQQLLGVFLTPGYRSWDPSRWVLAAFVLFFGMVMADAGYAVVMGLALLALRPWRRRLARSRSAPEHPGWALAWMLVASTAAWGLCTGTWFGVVLPGGHPLHALVLLDASDFRLMMRVSLLVGVAHLTLANLAQARASRGWRRLAALGWSAVLAGGALIGFSDGRAWAQWAGPGGQVLLAVGLVLALVSATVQGRGPGGRLAALLSSLMRVPTVLGDTLSYLRLFALGFAGASLAAAFNDLARQTLALVPGFGVLLAGLLLLLGHTLNLVLGLAGGFVHGLRLNFIEFINWSGVEEGRPFTPFHLKDRTPWTLPRR